MTSDKNIVAGKVLPAFSAIAAAIALIVSIQAISKANDTSQFPEVKVLTVSYESLVREKILQLGEDVRSGRLEAAQMSIDASEHSIAVISAIHEYAEQGYLVLRNESVLGAPAGVVDVTADIQADLIRRGLLKEPEKKDSPNVN